MTYPEFAAMEYWIDAWQRAILFWDVFRERGNQYLEHERTGKPPVLAFEYETVLDGRELPRPAAYALVRVKPPAGFPAADPAKRAFVVIDPRAGHGPGIGGAKIDSEVGIALRQGHPCYFVIFFPEPVPGQTIEAVCAAQCAFIAKVNELHPHADGSPFVIGNCQGGWALMMLAAQTRGELGPILLAGSPISSWAGRAGENPMRYTGGLLGGTWLASLAGDLGHGRFDGALLVNNFEQLDPANAYWSKPYHLYSNVDTESERFLEFEKWWGGHYLLGKQEMEWITQNLFVGNRLSSGELESADGGHRVDLRDIRSPIIVFASWGDNITPPQQALNWIPDVYRNVEEIRANEQTIVYLLHERTGHLGLFVSSGIASRETDELVSALELIETLPPGLYEAAVEDVHPEMPGMEFIKGRYLIRFVPRTIEDVLALDDGRQDERAFEAVARVSDINQNLYDRFLSPAVQALSSEASAKALRALNPARMERILLSDLNPWIHWTHPMAAWVRANRRPADPNNPLLRLEHQIARQVEQALDGFRRARDSLYEQSFKAIYESPSLDAALGPRTATSRGPKTPSLEHVELERLKRLATETQIEKGSMLDGAVRILVYTCHPPEEEFDERPYNVVRRMIDELPEEMRPTRERFNDTVKRQAAALALDEERSLAALPKLLPGARQRQMALNAARSAALAHGRLAGETEARLRRVEAILGIGSTSSASRNTNSAMRVR